MQIYNYIVKDEMGATLKGKVEARDERHAVDILRAKKMVVISLKEVSQSNFMSYLPAVFKRVKSKDLVSVTHQLATMLDSGLPLSDALEILKVQSNSSISKVLAEVQRDIQGGNSFAEALSRHDDVFSNVYIALVRAGEAAGKLDIMLNRLAESEESKSEFKQKTKGALVYPAIVVVAMVLVVAVLMIFVVPQLTTMYESFGAELPLITRVLIIVADGVRMLWWIIALGIIGAFYGLFQWKKTAIGRRKIDQLLLKIPIVGALRSEVVVTEFAMTLALLVSAGVSILQALEIVKGSMDNVVFSEALTRASKGVEKGLPLAVMLAREQVFPMLLSQMIAVGEETGELEKVLVKVAHYYKTESEQKVRNLTTALEPIIMMVLAVVVGFIVMAVITPLYSLVELF